MATSALASKDIQRLFGEGTLAARPDAQLLSAFVSRRDENAFAAVVARHGPMVLGTCRAVLKDPHAAEDAFQATFLILARKAAQLHAGESLGGWLHRVAVRVAVESDRASARRKRVEGEAAATRVAAGHFDDPADAEIRALVQSEVNRLPEGLRLPVVLCDLGGLTREQAARELRWTEGTVRGRLARGRSLLRDRLARRGLAPPAALAAKIPLPATWAVATARAAAGKAPKAAALLLAGRVARRALLLRAALGFAAVAGLGLIAWGVSGLRPPSKPPAPPPRPAAAPLPLPAWEEDGDEDKVILKYRGRVVDPAGRPVAGAREFVLADFRSERSSSLRATAGANGRFSFSIPLADFDDRIYGRHARVAATAEGFGIGLTDSEIPDAGRDLTLRLVEDVPIEGRVVDLEGRPVAGATVTVAHLWSPPGGDLTPWLDAVKADEDNLLNLGYKYLSIRLPEIERDPAMIPPTTTGGDGRFTIKGVGRERLAELKVVGRGLSDTGAEVITRVGGGTRALHDTGDPKDPSSTPIHDARPTIVVGPSRPVVGVVRDGSTGEPVAGATVSVSRRSSNWTLYPYFLDSETRSDAAGRYRIDGLPITSGTELTVKPPDGSPCLPARAFVENAPGVKPVTCDVALAHGVIVEGRVVDRASGRPLNAAVSYHAAGDNPALEGAPAFKALNRYSYPYALRVRAKPDGSFAVAGLAGKGVLVVEVFDRDYPEIDEKDWGERGVYTPEPETRHAVVPLDLKPGDAPGPREVRVERGPRVPGTLVDPDGRPLENAYAWGLDGPHALFWTKPLPGASFVARNFRPVPVEGKAFPGLPLLFSHPGRKLAAWVTVDGGEKEPLTVTAKPWGVLTGRLVDAEGKPLAGVALDARMTRPGGPPDEWFDHRPDRIQTDADGRFRVEGTIPGLLYRVFVYPRPKRVGVELGTTEPGQARDVGDLVVKPKAGDG